MCYSDCFGVGKTLIFLNFIYYVILTASLGFWKTRVCV